VVSFHLLCSLAIIGLSVLFLHRLASPAPAVVVRGPALVLAWLTFASAWLVLYLGTVVTGSGPHAGDEDSVRNGLDPLQVSQLHADSVFLFLGLSIGLFFTVRSLGLPTRPLSVLLVVIVAQGAIGFVQYLTDLPIVLVGFHMLGAALVSASVTWVLLSVREPGFAVVSRGSGEIATVSDTRTVDSSPPPRTDAPQR
jgi:cytochrome c oxidase assembly protein subunit 15